MAIIPSVVSMPPNISTAALETTSSRSSPAASSATAATRESAASRSSAGPSASRSAAKDVRPRSLSGRPFVSSSTASTIPSYQPSTTSGGVPRRPSACITTAAASGPAKLRRSSVCPSGAKASISRSVSSATLAVKRSRTASSRNGGANGARWRRCSGPSSVSMLGPTTRPVEKRGSSTVNVSGAFITSIARSRRVTSQPSSTDTHDTGSCARRRASSA